MTEYITRTPRAELSLTTTDDLTTEEWETLTASLAALHALVVPEGRRVVSGLLSELEGLDKNAPSDNLTSMVQEATASWRTGNVATYKGPLDASVMGLRLSAGDTATLTESHKAVHHDTMHRWSLDQMGGSSYRCGHGGCTAHVVVTSEAF